MRDNLHPNQSAFDLEGARAARDEAVARVETHADAAWLKRANEALNYIARTQRELTANDLWRYVEKPREPRASGPVMTEGKKRRYIVPAVNADGSPKFAQCESKTRHAGTIRVWESLIYGT